MTVEITPIGVDEVALWRLVREVSDILHGLPWILVGGLMVRVLETEYGGVTSFATGDVDTVLDVRAVSNATEDAAKRLVRAGFRPVLLSEAVTYRFVRDRDIVDVLAPDNMGDHANLATIPPNVTIEAAGSRQAFGRRRVLVVDAGAGRFDLPIPSLVGAIVMKARVAGLVQEPHIRAKHARDLARLLALLPDPSSANRELSRKERRYLAAHAALSDPRHPAWTNVIGAQDGAIALRILTASTGDV